MKTIVRLIIVLMASFVFGTLAKATETHKREVFCNFITMVNTMIIEVPNHTIEFNNTTGYTANTLAKMQMNIPLCIGFTNTTSTATGRSTNPKEMRNFLADPVIGDSG